MNSSLKKVAPMTAAQRQASLAVHRGADAALKAMQEDNKNWSPLWPEDQYRKPEKEEEEDSD